MFEKKKIKWIMEWNKIFAAVKNLKADKAVVYWRDTPTYQEKMNL